MSPPITRNFKPRGYSDTGIVRTFPEYSTVNSVHCMAYLVAKTATVGFDAVRATMGVRRGPGLGPHVKPFVLGRHGESSF